MTPFELVQQHYTFPSWLTPFPLQVKAINEQATLAHSGQWLDTGTGKTFVATATSLFKLITQRRQTVVIMPPILVRQWANWLRTITPALSITEYRGTPAKRKALSLNADFVLVGAQVFQRDYERFSAHFFHVKPNVVIDEATMVANVGTQTHDSIYEFAMGCNQELLTGTPASNPMNAYGLLKFTSPGTYRNLKHFENMHVEGRDFFDNPCDFKDLHLLRGALERNSQRILFEDLYPDIEEPLYSHYNYDLDDKHYKLYTELAENQLLLLPDGGKIEATTASKIIHALGQIVGNWHYFSQDPKNISQMVRVIEQKMGELGDKKLVVFANYRMTIKHLTEYFTPLGAVAVNSEVSEGQKAKNIQRFCDDPKCRLIMIQPRSGGYGVDGLQRVCHHAMFVEPCTVTRDFHQAVARLKRTGQTKRVMVHMPTASGTVQMRGFRALLKNDALTNQIIRNKADLRDMLFGR